LAKQKPGLGYDGSQDCEEGEPGVSISDLIAKKKEKAHRDHHAE
jgi:hypothetical protein